MGAADLGVLEAKARFGILAAFFHPEPLAVPRHGLCRRREVGGQLPRLLGLGLASMRRVILLLVARQAPGEGQVRAR